MKVKALINKLQKLSEKHGNFNVKVWSTDDDEGDMGKDLAGFIRINESEKRNARICSLVLCDKPVMEDSQ